MVSARALHYVLKIGDRGANINFFRNILGMQVFTNYPNHTTTNVENLNDSVARETHQKS